MNETRLSPDDPRLTAYALGELQEDERAAVEAALEHDPAARAIVEETRLFADQLKSALEHEPEPETAPALEPTTAASPKRLGLPEYDGGLGPKYLRFPQLYYIVGGLAAACFAVMVALHEEKPVVTYTVVDLRPSASGGGGHGSNALASGEEAGPRRGDAKPSVSSSGGPASVATTQPAGLLDQVKAEAQLGAGRTIAEVGAEPVTRVDLRPLAPTEAAGLGAGASGTATSSEVPGAEHATTVVLRVPERHPDAPFTDRIPANAATPAAPGAPNQAAAATNEAMALSSFEASPRPASVDHSDNTLAGSRIVTPQSEFAKVDLRALRTAMKPLVPGKVGVLPIQPDLTPAAWPYGGDFVGRGQAPVVTLSIPWDTGSYAKIRAAIEAEHLPAPEDVRIEELLNDFPPTLDPAKPHVVAAAEPSVGAWVEVMEAPWAPRHRLVRIELRGGLNALQPGTPDVVAKDVKIEVEFNPRRVAMYRLIGYEKAARAADRPVATAPAAGSIDAGQVVNALFEVVPAAVESDEPSDEGTYGPVRHLVTEERPRAAPQMLTLRVQYRHADTGARDKLTVPFVDNGAMFASASSEFKFCAGVAAYGMILRDSPHRGKATLDNAIAWASAGVSSPEDDPGGARTEFIDLMRRTKHLMH